MAESKRYMRCLTYSSSITTRTTTTTAIEYQLTKTGDVLANKLLIAVLYWIVVTLIIARIDKVSHLHTINLHLVGYIVQRRMEKMLKRQTAITISAIELTTCNLFQTYQLSVSLSDGWLGKWPRWKIVRKNCNKQLISQALSGMKTIRWQTFSKPDNIFWPKWSWRRREKVLDSPGTHSVLFCSVYTSPL